MGGKSRKSTQLASQQMEFLNLRYTHVTHTYVFQPLTHGDLPSTDLQEPRELFITIENVQLDIFINVFSAFDKCYIKQFETKTVNTFFNAVLISILN